MKKEFEEIGKKMPYSVPEGFFQDITGLTLEKAKRRELASRKKISRIRWWSAAAMITGIILATLWIIPKSEKERVPQTSENPLEITFYEGISKSETPNIKVDSLSPDPAQNTENILPVKDSIYPESMDQLLASLSDEALLHWVTLLNSDPFSEETENSDNYESN